MRMTKTAVLCSVSDPPSYAAPKAGEWQLSITRGGMAAQGRKRGSSHRLDAVAEPGAFLGAQLIELGAQPNVAALDDVQLELLLAAGLGQQVRVVPQALVHAALPCKVRNPHYMSNHIYIYILY